MIDPAIIDLIHHLGQQPPAIVRPFEDTKAPSANATGQHVQRVEQWSADWIAEAQKRVESLIRDFEDGPVEPHHLVTLDRAIELIEESIPAEARIFKKQQKVAHRLQKQLKSEMPSVLPRYNAERARNFRAISESALVRADLCFALKALRARHDSRANEGPAFDNSRALGDYLRAAIA